MEAKGGGKKGSALLRAYAKQNRRAELISKINLITNLNHKKEKTHFKHYFLSSKHHRLLW